jgi:Transposase DDE domain group 1
VQSTQRHSHHDRRYCRYPSLPAVCRKKLTVDFNGGAQSSDGGLLLLRAAERKLGVCARLAAAMPDRRNPDRILHEMFEMVMARSSADLGMV